MRRKNLIIFLGILILISLVTTVAFAGNRRCLDCTVTTDTTSGGGKGGKNSLVDIPVIEAGGKGNLTINNLKSLFGRGKFVGLGSTDLEVELEATALLENITCTNHGGQLVEVQPRHVTVVELQFIPSSKFDKNGSTQVNLSTDGPVIKVAALCPNGNWTATADGRWQGPASITSTQSDDPLVLNFDCNQLPGTSDVTCDPVN